MVEFLLYALILGFTLLYIVPFIGNSLVLPVVGKIPNSKFFNPLPTLPTYATYGITWSLLSVLLWGAILAGVIWLLSMVRPIGKIISEEE